MKVSSISIRNWLLLLAALILLVTISACGSDGSEDIYMPLPPTRNFESAWLVVEDDENTNDIYYQETSNVLLCPEGFLIELPKAEDPPTPRDEVVTINAEYLCELGEDYGTSFLRTLLGEVNVYE